MKYSPMSLIEETRISWAYSLRCIEGQSETAGTTMKVKFVPELYDNWYSETDTDYKKFHAQNRTYTERGHKEYKG